ncbi:hypothetical protein [Streptomyces sp. NPDC056628]|uniref:hypothetical protein n=1 Tax=Streptomyces sp. NPDC056628 TaxID=3345882 RepID=UPI00367E59B3
MHQDLADMGPVDHLIVEFPGSRTTVDRGVVRVLDLAFVREGTDGTVESLEPTT